MAGIRRTPQAEADLADIWSYIARYNLAAADNLIREIAEWNSHDSGHSQIEYDEAFLPFLCNFRRIG